MKYSEKMFFAQPVLRNGSNDFPQGAFSVDVKEATVNEDVVEFCVKAQIICPSLTDLIKQGSASVAVFLTCMDTRISNLFPLHVETEKRISVPSAKLFGRVTILPLVFSVQQVNGWESQDLHVEYGGQVNLLAATLLAVGEEVNFSVDRKRLKPLESIFELAEDASAQKGTIKVDADNQKISLLAHPETKIHLDGIRNSHAGRAILLNSIYLPALMEVFSQIQQNESSLEQYAWFRIFKAKCDAHSIDPMKCPILDASQTLLGIPFLKLQSVASDLL